MQKNAATQPAKAQATTTSANKSKTEKIDSKKSRQLKQQTRELKSKIKEETSKKEERDKKYREARYDYKDPYQLSEGEIMIVIEHSDDPGRVLMSTSHDYDKYKRIASKIRQWILRDFPSMKVIIKPNNHQSDNKRIGCFEISYFHMKEGKLERQDIFSKMVERKWPKWKEVQGKIKMFVKNSNLIVEIVDESQKNQFEGMVIHIKNVLFTKTSTNSGATTKSLMGSDLFASQNMHASQTMGHSTMGKSLMARSQKVTPQAESTLANFAEKVSDSSGKLKFDHLPVGNYAIVFNGDRTYKPANQVSSFQIALPSQCHRSRDLHGDLRRTCRGRIFPYRGRCRRYPKQEIQDS